MRNIWRVKNYERFPLSIVISSIIFISIVVWMIIGVNSASASKDIEQLKATKKSISNAVILCYSIEGEYPSSLEYLEENYGIKVDNDRYVVRYNSFASNIMPEITVLNR